jgi:hypothetical protein
MLLCCKELRYVQRHGLSQLIVTAVYCIPLHHCEPQTLPFASREAAWSVHHACSGLGLTGEAMSLSCTALQSLQTATVPFSKPLSYKVAVRLSKLRVLFRVVQSFWNVDNALCSTSVLLSGNRRDKGEKRAKLSTPWSRVHAYCYLLSTCKGMTSLRPRALYLQRRPAGSHRTGGLIHFALSANESWFLGRPPRTLITVLTELPQFLGCEIVYWILL